MAKALGSGEHLPVQCKRKYFEVGTELPLDEDSFIEFKGHRSLVAEEIPPACFRPHPDREESTNFDPLSCFRRGPYSGRQSRQPVSKAINAFLNSGKGGIVYLGITDAGLIGGIKLTQYQKDHVLKSLNDMMSRYTPAVSKNRLKLTFIPCLRKGLNESEIETCLNYQELVDEPLRKKEHVLRTYKYCWCDYDAEAMLSHGNIPPSYVIEITVSAWIPSEKPLNISGLSCVDTIKSVIPPVFQDEEGNCYYRGQASVKPLTKQQVYSMTLQHVYNFYSVNSC